jgi:hypothetical protein
MNAERGELLFRRFWVPDFYTNLHVATKFAPNDTDMGSSWHRETGRESAAPRRFVNDRISTRTVFGFYYIYLVRLTLGIGRFGCWITRRDCDVVITARHSDYIIAGTSNGLLRIYLMLAPYKPSNYPDYD